MPYRDIEDRRAASRRHYESHVDLVKARAAEYRTRKRQGDRDFVNQAKSRPCTDCGNEYPPYVMQFDHVGTGKEFNISQAAGRGYGRQKIQAEIDKCEVVCANCHAVRTWIRANC